MKLCKSTSFSVQPSSFQHPQRHITASIVLPRCQRRQSRRGRRFATLQKDIENIASITPIESIKTVSGWVDDVKERGMKRIKPLYTHEEWTVHRSSTRHLRHLLSSLSSRVILSLIPPVAAFTAVSALVASYNTVCIELYHLNLPLLHGSSLPFQLTAPALALLLVFRTEASYSRFEEGRRLWNNVLSHSLDFARQVASWIPNGNRSGQERLLRYVMAFPVALKCHIIHGSDMRHGLSKMLNEDELLFVVNSKHPPNCLIQLMSQCVEQAELDISKRTILDSHISVFNESTSTCEKIIGIPIPLSYTRLTSRFLVLWHLTLPIVLWDECKWLVVPATFVSAASLFCIEEVGVLIEEPFPMLPLEQLCRTVVENIKENIKLNHLIKKVINSENDIFT